MTNKTLLVIHAVIYEVFAILLFFFPDLMWPLYGVEIKRSIRTIFITAQQHLFRWTWNYVLAIKRH